ncbi:trypsin-like serine protease [Halobacteriovorax sp. RZ-1]|uniref:trypsin-like serine peptidase n=1 Tax=unclassified Halobacteriovorax TaxID=2639665 RepID=UPI0037110DCB
MSKLLKILPLLTLAILSTGCGKDSVNTNLNQIIEGNSVIGKDDRRVSANNLPRSLSNRVGQLVSTIPLRNSISTSTCTGSLIADDYVITAAHCIMSLKIYIKTDTIFYPGQLTSESTPEGGFIVTQAYILKEYFEEDLETVNPNTDIAILKIKKNSRGESAGRLLGEFQMTADGPTKKTDEILTIGYPGDLIIGTQYFQKDCKVNNRFFNRSSIKFECDTYLGQSGGPLLRYNQNSHDYEVFGIVSSELPSINLGAKITNSRLEDFQTIINGGVPDKKWMKFTIKGK